MDSVGATFADRNPQDWGLVDRTGKANHSIKVAFCFNLKSGGLNCDRIEVW